MIRSEQEVFDEWHRVAAKAHPGGKCSAFDEAFAMGAEVALAWALRLGQANGGRASPSETLRAMRGIVG